VTADAAAHTGSKVDLAHRVIRSRILDGAYTPGYRLVLGTLARELGVSTVPVREAVRRLEAEGLVEVVRNVGATVRGLDPVEYRWTVETLAVVEAAATGLAAAHLRPADLAAARRLNDAMRDGLADLDPLRHTRLNQRFHRVLSAPCPNPHLLGLVERGWTRVSALRSTVFSFVPERAAGSVAEHDALLDLVERGAPAAEVEAAARAHRLRTLDAVLHSPTVSDSPPGGTA
jgi:DNA-binding GntR family transcriptional regulator